jgi:dihydrolipoamide dehydrogenase
MYDLVVIGAGPGGYEAAAHAARAGKKVALIEKSRTGGTCLNVGCIPTKALLKSARVFSEYRSAPCYGVHTGEVRFDMPAVIERKNRIVATLTRGVDAMLRRAGVERIAGHGRLASAGSVEVNGERLAAHHILIATGSRPAVPPITGIGSAEVRDSTSILDERNAPSKLVIIGAGYIGLEFASFFSVVGTAVTVIEMLPRAAGNTDPDVTGRLLEVLQKGGAALRLGCRVTRIESGSVEYVDHEGNAQTVSAEMVLNATGRVPVVDDLGLDAAGVDYGSCGIRTSDQGRPNVPGIWACGDVTGRRLLAHAATRDGIVAVNNMFGGRDRIRYLAIPTVIYTHPEIASAGWTEEELHARGIPFRSAIVPMAVSGRFVVENEGGAGLVKVLAGKRYGEILGVHIAGDGASEFIVLAAAMIETEMQAAQAAELVFPHPTVSEALKSAILELA